MAGQAKLKKPRRVAVNPEVGWYTTRIYVDVKCGYCPFHGANHHKNFATRMHPKWGNKTPCCHACARKRRGAAIRREKFIIGLQAAELKARRRMRLPPKKRTVRDGSSRRAAVRATLRRRLRGGRRGAS
jgi:hypothetical protein